MLESIGCTPLHSWLLLGAGIFIGAPFGAVIAGLCRAAKENNTPWMFWCPRCKSVVMTQYEEEA